MKETFAEKKMTKSEWEGESLQLKRICKTYFESSANYISCRRCSQESESRIWFKHISDTLQPFMQRPSTSRKRPPIAALLEFPNEVPSCYHLMLE